jgi:hypothetical protein
MLQGQRVPSLCLLCRIEIELVNKNRGGVGRGEDNARSMR